MQYDVIIKKKQVKLKSCDEGGVKKKTKQAKSGLQSRSGCHGQLSWMTFVDDFYELLLWMTCG